MELASGFRRLLGAHWPAAREAVHAKSRELARWYVENRLIEELENNLRGHKELEQIAIARRKTELSESPEVSELFEKFMEEMVKKNPLLEQLLGPGFRIPNPFKPHLVEIEEKPFEGVRFPTRFHFKGLQPSKALDRDAHLNSQVRITFDTDAENEYFRRDEEPGDCKLFQLINGKLTPAKNWQTPHLFEGSATLTLALPEEAEVGDTLTFEAVITDPSRIEPFTNRFTLTVREERKEQPPKPPKPKQPETPTDKDGKDKPNDTKLNMPKPQEVYEPAWGQQDPKFDRFTAMRVKRPPKAPEDSHVYDYFINMDNVFLVQALKAQPNRALDLKERFKFGMTIISPALIRFDLEAKKREGDKPEADDQEGKQKPQDIHETVADVTSALAPFLLPLVDSLSELTGVAEPLSAVAGEAA